MVTFVLAPVAPAPGLCEGAIDLGFVLDSSSSIGDDSFQLVRDFTAEVTQRLSRNSHLVYFYSVFLMTFLFAFFSFKLFVC